VLREQILPPDIEVREALTKYEERLCLNKNVLKQGRNELNNEDLSPNK
jgi:hypothetical protein